MHAIFKADGDETNGHYDMSEWWLDPHTHGPTPHTHDSDDVFFVIEGTMDFYVDGEWISAPRGTFVLVPGGVPHAFKNSTDEPAGAFNIGSPGGFEARLPELVAYFADHPNGPA
jgi:mannose-6-phosphate isomerase-like protein (cupin superfamily)